MLKILHTRTSVLNVAESVRVHCELQGGVYSGSVVPYLSDVEVRLKYDTVLVRIKA